MRSLKSVLIIWTVIATSVIFIGAGSLLYVLVRARLVQQFDRYLIDKARFLSAITEQSAGKLHLEFDEFESYDFGSAEDRLYLQVWMDDGTSVYRSPTLEDANLEPFGRAIDSPDYRWVDLPSGRRRRAVGLSFTPRDEHAARVHESKNGKDESHPRRGVAPRMFVAEHAELLISEFSAANKSTLADEDGDFSDWLEITNVSQRTVDLDGWRVTDRAQGTGWRFPKVTVNPGDNLVVFASGKDRRGAASPLHTDFKLDADGEYLALMRSDGRTIECAYEPSFPQQVADASFGLASGERAPGYFRKPTPGRANAGERSDEPPVPIAGRITLVLARDATTIDEPLASLATVLIAVGGVTIPALAGTLWLIVRRNLVSLERLAWRIGQLRGAELSGRIDVPRCPAELVPVIDRLNQLLAQLEATLNRERGFSADVAHELRTPLAGMLLKMDLMLSRMRQPEQYASMIEESREIAIEMQRMVENLLSLSRLEGGRIELDYEPVAVNRLIRDTWKPLADAAEMRRVEVNWFLAADALMVTDEVRLQVAIRNILENAAAYVDEGGSVKIESRVADDRVKVCVGNSGSELTESEVHHVFERFWRGDVARSETGVHCGLGLSITSRIVAVLGGTVAANASKGGEFEIAISLPKDPTGLLGKPDSSSSPSTIPAVVGNLAQF